MKSDPTTAELQALACEDCPAAVTVQRGQGIAAPVLVVTVEHDKTCPWARRFVPPGGATLVAPEGVLLHCREGEPVALGISTQEGP